MENKMSKIIVKRSDNKYNERLVTTIGFTNPMVLPDIKLYFKSETRNDESCTIRVDDEEIKKFHATHLLGSGGAGKIVDFLKELFLINYKIELTSEDYYKLKNEVANCLQKTESRYGIHVVNFFDEDVDKFGSDALIVFDGLINVTKDKIMLHIHNHMGNNVTPTEKNVIYDYVNTIIERAMTKYYIVNHILIDVVNTTSHGLTYIIDPNYIPVGIEEYNVMFKNKLHIIEIIEKENLEYCEEKEIEHLDLVYSTKGLTNSIDISIPII